MRLFRKLQPQAFTLIELLLVISLFSVISIAVYKALSGGLAIWERRSRAQVQEDLLISFEKITEDLQKAVVFSRIPFEGGKSRISFASIVRTPADRFLGRNNEYVEQIGQVGYYFDSVRKVLIRTQKNYSQAVNKKSGSERVLAGELTSVRFVYFYREENSYTATEKSLDTMPAALIVTAKFFQGGREQTVSRTIIIPLGTSG